MSFFFFFLPQRAVSMCDTEPVFCVHWLTFIKQLLYATGEGNGTPLQYSCLENPMDGGAW